MPVELYLARRYLLDRRHGAWGWLISLIATGSVALGVAALIVTLAIMTGFRNDIRSKMLGVQPHVLISSFSGRLNVDDPSLAEALRSESEVTAWSPYVSGQILIGRGRNSTGATVRGVIPERERTVANLENRLVLGRWENLAEKGRDGRPRIFLGQELARNVGAGMGDVVWVITPSSIDISGFSVPRAHLFEVAGLVKTGLYDYDSILAYTAIDEAQDLFGLEDDATGIGVRVEDPERAEAVAAELRAALAGRYWVRSWLEQNRNLFSALKLERTVMFIILAMLTVVASFMIVSNLLLNITQKVKEIGILRAMGATKGTIRRTFLYQGLLMGVVGSLVGVCIGVGLSLILAETNFIRLPADVYYIDRLPIRLVFGDIVSVVVLAAGVVLMATFFPARKASNLDPIEAIRFG